MEAVICEICNAPSAVEITKRKETKYKHVPIVLDDVSVFHCNECGEEYFSPDQLEEFSARSQIAWRRKMDLLSPEEIVEIRKKHELKQDDLEELIGAGQKVVTRWERGEVLQPKPVDLLLRLIKDFPDTIARIRGYRRRSA